MRRRSFLAVPLALGWLPARAARVATVAYLAPGGPGAGLAKAMAARGYVEGRNLRYHVRIAGDDPAALDAAARELVALEPDVSVALFQERVRALQRAAPGLAVVAGLHDPVVEGFASSLSRPGGRVTGLAFSSPEGMKMTFRLLGATLPRLRRIHAFATRDFHAKPTVVVTRRAISEERGYVFVEHSPAGNAEAERIVRAIRDPGEEAIVVGLLPGFDPTTFSEAVLRARVPAIDTSGRMKTGSLLSAGLYHADLWGRLAAIVDQVLRGADPAHIPIEQPTHAEVTLDLRTAAAIGVTFPREVLMRATQIIE